jgi:hypothetical protein
VRVPAHAPPCCRQCPWAAGQPTRCGCPCRLLTQPQPAPHRHRRTRASQHLMTEVPRGGVTFGFQGTLRSKGHAASRRQVQMSTQGSTGAAHDSRRTSVSVP